jgi:hypothetical protein
VLMRQAVPLSALRASYTRLSPGPWPSSISRSAARSSSSCAAGRAGVGGWGQEAVGGRTVRQGRLVESAGGRYGSRACIPRLRELSGG